MNKLYAILLTIQGTRETARNLLLDWTGTWATKACFGQELEEGLAPI